MKVKVTYHNDYRNEHEEYTTTLGKVVEEVIDSFVGIVEPFDPDGVQKELLDTGSVTIANGYATTTLERIGA